MGRHAVAVAKAAEVDGADIGPPKPDAINGPPPGSILVSQYERALLPWEDAGEFRALHAAFHAEHRPNGATEASLVDQLAWIEWRRRRLILGERAAHLASLQERIDADYKTKQTLARALLADGTHAENDELQDTLRHSAGDDDADIADANSDERMTLKGIAILEKGGTYEAALGAVRSDTRDWWDQVVGDDEETHPDGQQQPDDSYEPYARNREQLLRFLKTDVLSMLATTRAQTARRPAIRMQAWGESLDPFRLERVYALDERLTRQFGKTLAMLIRLREMRLAGAATA